MPPPEIISGGIVPLMHSMTARPLRYRPIAGDFVIRNGGELFNRPLYAPCSTTQTADFRVDASDLPEFSLYLPGHGGNLKLGFIAASGAASKWAAVADEVVARYRPGRMIYEIRDSLLGSRFHPRRTPHRSRGLRHHPQGRGQQPSLRHAPRLGLRRSQRQEGPPQRRHRLRGPARLPVLPGHRRRVRLEISYKIDSTGGGPAVAHLSSQAAQIALTFPTNSRLASRGFRRVVAAPGCESERHIRHRPVLTGSSVLTRYPLYI